MFFYKKWEYRMLNITIDGLADNQIDLTNELNKQGQQGFELVSVKYDKNVKQFYFKRRI